ncbi:pentapeptide repeat-containing protein [Actinomadura sp. DSM 109109]|nr:pentapeptide repeat-containing protein [Actinomadura lepetitiana]
MPRGLAPAGRVERHIRHDGRYLSLEYGAGTLSMDDPDGVEDVDFERCRFDRTAFSGVVLHRAGFADCAFGDADLANLRAFDSRMFNVRIMNTRMTGMQLGGSGLRDVLVEGCRADLTGFRHAHLRDVVFRDCNLAEATFQSAELSGVRFENCRLSGAQFSGAKMSTVRFRGCDLRGVGGLDSFRGATVASGDAMGLLEAFAAELGITIED